MLGSAMTFHNLSDRDQEIVSTIHHLIVTHWVEAAAAAWVSYQAHGRGAVILDFRPYDTPPNQLPFAGYARQQDVASNAEELAQLHDMIASYHPETDLVYFIYTPLGDTLIEQLPTLDGRPTPPQAAAQRRSHETSYDTEV